MGEESVAHFVSGKPTTKIEDDPRLPQIADIIFRRTEAPRRIAEATAAEILLGLARPEAKRNGSQPALYPDDPKLSPVERKLAGEAQQWASSRQRNRLSR